jgi:hypothetical protein
MEFLANHARLLLVLLATLAVLTHFGLLTPEYMTPESCTAFKGITCEDKKATPTQIEIQLMNVVGDTITIYNISADGCIGTAKGTLLDGKTMTFTITGCNLTSGSKYTGDYYVTYMSHTGLMHNEKGSIVTKVR